MNHEFLSLIVPVKQEYVGKINAALDKLGNPARKEIVGALRGSGVHFVSMTVVEDQSECKKAFIVLEASIDESEKGSISIISGCLDIELREILREGGIDLKSNQLASFLSRHRQEVKQSLSSKIGLNFTGTPGMTVERIHKEESLSQACRTILESSSFNHNDPFLEQLKVVRTRVADNAKLKSQLDAEPSPFTYAEDG